MRACLLNLSHALKHEKEIPIGTEGLIINIVRRKDKRRCPGRLFISSIFYAQVSEDMAPQPSRRVARTSNTVHKPLDPNPQCTESYKATQPADFKMRTDTEGPATLTPRLTRCEFWSQYVEKPQ